MGCIIKYVRMGIFSQTPFITNLFSINAEPEYYLVVFLLRSVMLLQYIFFQVYLFIAKFWIKSFIKKNNHYFSLK